MYTCGFNKFFQLDKNSNNKNSVGSPIIDKPVKYHVDASSFSSISMNHYQTVWISKDGKSYARGNNSDFVISRLLPKETLGDDTELFLKDNRDRPCKLVSVHCGFGFTLYLVSDESVPSNFTLIYSHLRKTRDPNPLFLNIGNRIPRAIFGGHGTAGVIDTEGGIIDITESIFESPTQKVEPKFLPHRDKAVKLACCTNFFISLGKSGRVYMSEISGKSPLKFSEVNELSDKKVVDVAGTNCHCFAVLNTGQVFGFGSNYSCALGLPAETKSVSSFTEVESLKKYKIVSAFAGSFHSIFKTDEGKMIVCGSNDEGQLFIPRKKTVFPPEEVNSFNGFSFCIVGSGVSAAFLGMDPPPNVANQKITSDSISRIKNPKDEEIARLKKENTRLKTLMTAKLESKEAEILKLKEEVYNLKKRNKNLEIEVKKLKNESKSKSEAKGKEKSFKFEEENFFFGPEEEANFETVGIVGEGKTSTVYKIIDKRTNVPICKKVLKTEGSSFQDLQNAIKEFQVLHTLHHPSICYAIALNTSENVNDKKEEEEVTTVSFLLEFIDYNLKECLEKKMINNTLKTRIIVEISHGLKYLHSKNMIYRDLKLSNIMLNSVFQAKLIDFGLVKINEFLLGEDTMNSISMTNSVFDAVFMSPELLKDDVCNSKTDVFSFGIVLYFLFVGSLPNQSIKDKMMDKQIDLPDASPSISECCIELIRKCIEKDPKERPSFEDILNILRENKYMLAADVDPSIVSQRDQELEQINN